ncbi:aldolase (plasmid) [Agrobacterium leguminum]|uniref:3-oxo-tetronate 4-phosphate decarboxylase n=1 Tax=Agrobacterium leguminum TaxID=2792015 RepID=UPI00272B17B1|nr:aldolase [Agrobacterium leguminum]WLE00764.1 aldolase [Agrobacterium leguminum]
MTETDLRNLLVELAASLFRRGYSVGSAGNISVRLPDGYLITPTNSSLGWLEPHRISKLNTNWDHISGDRPSKEIFMHRAVLDTRPEAGAVVHLHSTYATAISCLSHGTDTQLIPPLTPYFVMRVGRHLPIIPYYRPGDSAMEQDIRAAAHKCSAMLLANHGSVVSGKTLREAVFAAEELEEAAKLSLLLRNQMMRGLSEEQIDDLLLTFGNP